MNRKAANQAHGHALEIIAFDEFVEVHAQHFKYENEVLAEHEFLFDTNYILFVLRVIISELI